MWHAPAGPSWKKCPSTLLLILLTTVLSLLWWCGADLSFLLCNFEVSQGQIYRLLTCILLQATILQLAFTCCWLFVLGGQLESEYGSLRFLAICLFLAVISSSADFALSLGGVGLTGVVFGLFALLWIQKQKDSRFAGSPNRLTIALFFASSLVCFIPQAGNIPAPLGHPASLMIVGAFAGACAGGLLGLALTASSTKRLLAGGLTAAFGVVCLGAAFFFRPAVNFQADLGSEFATLGHRALEANQFDQAAGYFRQAIERGKNEADYWYDLGAALTGMGQIEAATAVIDQAIKFDPQQQARKQSARDLADLGFQELEAGQFEKAADHYQQAIDNDRGEATYWYNLGTAYSRTSKFEAALPMFDQAVKLDPEDPDYKKARAWCKYMTKKLHEKNEKASPPTKP